MILVNTDYISGKELEMLGLTIPYEIFSLSFSENASVRVKVVTAVAGNTL